MPCGDLSIHEQQRGTTAITKSEQRVLIYLFQFIFNDWIMVSVIYVTNSENGDQAKAVLRVIVINLMKTTNTTMPPNDVSTNDDHGDHPSCE